MLNADEIYQKLIDAGDDWADRKEAANLLGKTEKILLAKLAKEADEKTVAAREREALCSEEYQEHVKIMLRADREADKAKVRYESAKVWCDFVRTLEATKRAEMKL